MDSTRSRVVYQQISFFCRLFLFLHNSSDNIRIEVYLLLIEEHLLIGANLRVAKKNHRSQAEKKKK